MKDVTEVKEIMALELETKSNKDSIVEHQNAFKLVELQVLSEIGKVLKDINNG
jgi:hypothetical protein